MTNLIGDTMPLVKSGPMGTQRKMKQANYAVPWLDPNMGGWRISKLMKLLKLVHL